MEGVTRRLVLAAIAWLVSIAWTAAEQAGPTPESEPPQQQVPGSSAKAVDASRAPPLAIQNGALLATGGEQRSLASFAEQPASETWRTGYNSNQGRTFLFTTADTSSLLNLPRGSTWRLTEVRAEDQSTMRDCVAAAVQRRMRVGYAPQPRFVTLTISDGNNNTALVSNTLYALTAEPELGPQRLRTRPLPGNAAPTAHPPVFFSINYPWSCGYIAEGDPCPPSSVPHITFKMDTVTVHLNANEYSDYMGGENPVHVYEPDDIPSSTTGLLVDHLYNWERSLFSTFWQSTNKQTGYYAYTSKPWATWFLANELLGAPRSYDRMVEFRVDADGAADASAKRRRDRGGTPKPVEGADEKTLGWALRLSPSRFHHDSLGGSANAPSPDRWMYRVQIEDASWAGGRTSSRIPRWFARMFGDNFFLKNTRAAWRGAREQGAIDDASLDAIVRSCELPATLATGAPVSAKPSADAELDRIAAYLKARAAWMDASLPQPTRTEGRTGGRTFLFEEGRDDADAIARDADRSSTPTRGGIFGGLGGGGGGGVGAFF